MSIWTDCEEYNAYPFYGFPVKPSFQGNIITFEFPLGYAPNGSQTDKIADTLNDLLGKEIIEVTDNIIKIKINPDKLGFVFYQYFLAVKSHVINPNSITI